MYKRQVAEATSYLAVEGSWTAPYTALVEEEKGKVLVRSTRFLNTLEYLGNALETNPEGQQWPRDLPVMFPLSVEHACARLAAFYVSNPNAEDTGVLISNNGRIVSLSAGGVSIGYADGAAKAAGDVQVAPSYDEGEALRLGIPDLAVYNILKPLLVLSADTKSGGKTRFVYAPTVRNQKTSLSTSLGYEDYGFNYRDFPGRPIPYGTSDAI